jgi:hypothetical protein
MAPFEALSKIIVGAAFILLLRAVWAMHFRHQPQNPLPEKDKTG